MRLTSNQARSMGRLASAIVLVVLLSELALFLALQSLFDKTVASLQRTGVTQSIELTEKTISTVQTRVFGVAAAHQMSRILNQGLDIVRDYEGYRNALRQLDDVASVVPGTYLREIFCYSDSDDSVLTAQGYIDRRNFRYSNVLDVLLASGTMLRWDGITAEDKQDAMDSIVLAVPVPISLIGRRSMVAILLDSRIITDPIELSAWQDSVSIAIVNHDGDILARRGETDWQELRSKTKELAEGVHLTTVADEKSYIVIHRSSAFPWSYIVSVKREAFLRQTGLFWRYAAIVVSLCLAGSILLSVQLSKVLGRPISMLAERLAQSTHGSEGSEGSSPEQGDPIKRIEQQFARLTRQNSDLQTRLLLDKEILRDSFIREIMTGSVLDNVEIARQGEYFGVHLECRGFLVLLVTFPSTIRSSTRTRQLFKTLVDTALARSSLSAQVMCQIVSEPDYLLILVGFAELSPSSSALGEEIHRSLSTEVDEFFQVCVGQVVSSAPEISLSYRDTMRLYRNARSTPGLTVLQADTLDSWPLRRELLHRFERLTETYRSHLAIGSYDAARKTAKDLIGDKDLWNTPLYGRMKLNEIANTLVSHIGYHLEPDEIFDEADNPWSCFLTIDESADMVSWIDRVFDSIGTYLEVRDRTSSRILVDKIKRRLEEIYTLPVSFQRLSEEFHVSSSYFSTVFKTQEGITCSEYLVRLRMEAACMDLRESRKALKEIACERGFGTKQNLIRTFKKRLLLTPTEYRNRCEVVHPLPEA